VFFNTAENLVPEDIDGRIDVYEYDDGELHLISIGTGDRDAFFGDATLSGDDVYFTTRQRLSGWDRDENIDLYVARSAGSAFPEPLPIRDGSCDGSACQGTPRDPARFHLPGSAIFSGPGDADDDSEAPRMRAFSVVRITARQQRAWSKTGRILLRVRVSDAGRVTALVTETVGKRTRTVARGARRVIGGSIVSVPLYLSPVARTQMRRTGKLRLNITVKYSGVSGAQRTRLTLKKAPARRNARPAGTGGTR
jgi:hypothetical protein